MRNSLMKPSYCISYKVDEETKGKVFAREWKTVVIMRKLVCHIAHGKGRRKLWEKNTIPVWWPEGIGFRSPNTGERFKNMNYSECTKT